MFKNVGSENCFACFTQQKKAIDNYTLQQTLFFYSMLSAKFHGHEQYKSFTACNWSLRITNPTTQVALAVAINCIHCLHLSLLLLRLLIAVRFLRRPFCFEYQTHLALQHRGVYLMTINWEFTDVSDRIYCKVHALPFQRQLFQIAAVFMVRRHAGLTFLLILY